MSLLDEEEEGVRSTASLLDCDLLLPPPNSRTSRGGANSDMAPPPSKSVHEEIQNVQLYVIAHKTHTCSLNQIGPGLSFEYTTVIDVCTSVTLLLTASHDKLTHRHSRQAVSRPQEGAECIRLGSSSVSDVAQCLHAIACRHLLDRGRPPLTRILRYEGRCDGDDRSSACLS